MKKSAFFLYLLSTILIITPIIAISQQVGDVNFNPVVPNPAYKDKNGPAIYIDEAHNNFHTLERRYAPFAIVLKKDGYQLFANQSQFLKAQLDKMKILVVANALNKKNIEDWSLPTPSAFSEAEIQAVVDWVKKGGSLFLIADHMPMPGAAESLAAEFGFKFYNGFAQHRSKRGSDIYSVKNNNLKMNKITRGRNQSEKIDSVATFTGQAFQIPKNAQPILVFDSNYIMRLPKTAWEFNDNTKQIEIAGFCQGAILKFGKGKVAVFGEAAMFTAQLSGNNKFGLSAPEASQNLQFLLNIIHWLDGIL